jgi:type II secretory pathway pseudopilin PulG
VKRKLNSQSGVGVLLLELLIVMAITAIILAASSASVLRIRAIQNQTDAKIRIRQVAQAQTAVAFCAIPANMCSAAPLAAILPPPGEVLQSGYRFTFVRVDPVSWTFTATPISAGFTGADNYFVDQTSIIRCGMDASAAPC